MRTKSSSEVNATEGGNGRHPEYLAWCGIPGRLATVDREILGDSRRRRRRRRRRSALPTGGKNTRDTLIANPAALGSLSPYSETTMYEPPVYVLLQPNHSSAPASFAHPVIEYHFTDDPATILLPSSEHESVLVVDYTSRDVAPAVQSLHPGIAISGLKIVDAPGVSAPPPDAKVPNDKIYIIETVSSIDGASKDQCVIARSLGKPLDSLIGLQPAHRLTTRNGQSASHARAIQRPVSVQAYRINFVF